MAVAWCEGHLGYTETLVFNEHKAIVGEKLSQPFRQHITLQSELSAEKSKENLL